MRGRSCRALARLGNLNSAIVSRLWETVTEAVNLMPKPKTHAEGRTALFFSHVGLQTFIGVADGGYCVSTSKVPLRSIPGPTVVQ